LLILGQAQDLAGQRGEAQKTAEQLVALAPQWAPAHHLLGILALRGRQAAEAETHLRRALALDAVGVAYHNDLGVALLRQGKIQEAIRHSYEAVRINP